MNFNPLRPFLDIDRGLEIKKTTPNFWFTELYHQRSLTDMCLPLPLKEHYGERQELIEVT